MAFHTYKPTGQTFTAGDPHPQSLRDGSDGEKFGPPPAAGAVPAEPSFPGLREDPEGAGAELGGSGGKDGQRSTGREARMTAGQGAARAPASSQARLPVWMSLCRSKFPMLLKIRPQISHGWMYLKPDTGSGRRAQPHRAVSGRVHLPERLYQQVGHKRCCRGTRDPETSASIWAESSPSKFTRWCPDSQHCRMRRCLETGVFTEVAKLKLRSSRQALIQYDWCPYKQGHRDAHRGKATRTQGEDGSHTPRREPGTDAPSRSQKEAEDLLHLERPAFSTEIIHFCCSSCPVGQTTQL